MGKMMKTRKNTRLTCLGRDHAAYGGAVNPPVYHVSTIGFSSVEELEAATPVSDKMLYGRLGTPTSRALETALADLEGGDRCFAVPSGLSAISAALLSVLKSGDHLLMTDSCYAPARMFCDGMLQRMGITTTYYDPLLGGDIADLFQENTRAVYVESPGSLTFEVQDIPAIAEAAHKQDILVLADNTWASPYFHRPLELGADVSILAATKYIVGHSDAMLGAVTVREPLVKQFSEAIWGLGLCAGPDDMYLGLRGLRTLGVRLERHQENALRVARWLKARPEVERVLYPALLDDPGHGIWKRDFDGAGGLFAFVLKPCERKAWEYFCNGMELFALGYSFGGFESLVLPAHPAKARTATTWEEEGQLIRVHIGLEDPDDLIADLEAGFERLQSV